MVDVKIVNILVDRIKLGKINPKTNEPFKVADILIDEYKIAVNEILKQE